MTLEQILNQTKDLTWQEKLIFVSDNFSDIAFSTSFSIEDQVIMEFIISNKLKIEIFTLDTGRLPKATYDLWQSNLDRYGVKIKAYYPNQDDLEQFISNKGVNAFYESQELRKTCCNIRKTEPLSRALKNKKLWISGLRKEHSNLRAAKDYFEEDKSLNLIKFYPLLEVSEDQLWADINQKNIPFNRLYKEGYRSIGCDPCSRAIAANQDVRAGRWWWENSQTKECGLHVTK